MPGIEQLLRDAGIPLDQRPADARAALARVASVLRRRRVRSLGLLPAADDVGVPGVALQAALAIAEVSAEPVGVVDPTGTWLDAVGRPDAEGPAVARVAELVALIALPRRPGSVAPALAKLLRTDARAHAHLVVDLSGLERTGDHVEAFSLVDGVAVVARAGRTTFAQLDRASAQIPGDKDLGVLLVGA